MRRFLIEFEYDVDQQDVHNALEKSNLPCVLVTVARNVQIERFGEDICLREVKPEEEAIRRIVRDELRRL